VKPLNQAQEEQLKEIAAQLRQVREEKSLSIEEIAAYTRIRPAFLEAIEEGRFEALPEPVYVQGFIRHFGNAVGVDGTALATSFANTFTQSEPQEDIHQPETKPNIQVPLAVPYVLLLAAASFGLFYVLNLQRSAESHTQNNFSSVATEEKIKIEQTPVTSLPAASSPSPTSVMSSPPLTDPTPSPTTATSSALKVSVELQGESWLRVKVDGKTEFEGILKKGERKTWTANKELFVRSGNAGAVLISTNNQPPKPLGAMGRIKEITYTPENVNSQ
jgi:cytoskeletal protein RodZ